MVLSTVVHHLQDKWKFVLLRSRNEVRGQDTTEPVCSSNSGSSTPYRLMDEPGETASIFTGISLYIYILLLPPVS